MDLSVLLQPTYKRTNLTNRTCSRAEKSHGSDFWGQPPSRYIRVPWCSHRPKMKIGSTMVYSRMNSTCLSRYIHIYIYCIYIFLKLVFSWSPYYPYQPFYCQWYFSRQWFPPMNKIVIPAGCFTRSCHITGLILLAKVNPSTIIQHCWTTIFLSIKNAQ